MRVIVYVEGPSDKAAMNALLGSLIEEKKRQGIGIDFFESPSGDKKRTLLLKVPTKAAHILANDPGALVVVMPDLYPKNKGFEHETVEELKLGIKNNFQKALADKGLQDDERVKNRLMVFCFKYDLEALLLASKEALENRLGAKSIAPTWTSPVEDQDHDVPPKRVIEKLFRQFGQKYVDTVDAPIILGMMSYSTVAERCPQCFKPFVEFLERLRS
jgi:hypothetical protein